MRTFSVTYTLPQSCDCCGHALTPHDGSPSLGTYKLELPDGSVSSVIHLGDLKIVLGANQLHIEIRHERGNNKKWVVKRHYNPQVFVKPRSEYRRDETNEDYGYYCFSFDLPEFKPQFKTWWAQLDLFEAVWVPTHLNDTPAHNSRTLSLKLNLPDEVIA